MSDETSNQPLGPGDLETVPCVKLGREAKALKKPPLKGDIGQKIYKNVSEEGWTMWLEHSKMLVNEFRLDLMSEQGQRIWFDEMEKFFWGEGSSAPPDFVEKKDE